MKTKVLLFLTVLLSVFSSCNKDDDNDSKFDYPIKTLHGTWTGSEVYLESTSKWIDITKYPYTDFGFSIKFNSDDTYSGSGYFGNGTGTYKAIGKTITTYVNGKEYARYEVKSLTANKAEFTMHMGGEQLDIRAVKK